jgi:hypothetical protein
LAKAECRGEIGLGRVRQAEVHRLLEKGEGRNVGGHSSEKICGTIGQGWHLTWDDVPAGQVVRGVIDPNEGKPLLKVVTRASTPEELAKYEHDRMPLIEPPLYSAEYTGVPFEQPKPRAPKAKPAQEAPDGPVQGDLF